MRFRTTIKTQKKKLWRSSPGIVLMAVLPRPASGNIRRDQVLPPRFLTLLPSSRSVEAYLRQLFAMLSFVTVLLCIDFFSFSSFSLRCSFFLHIFFIHPLSYGFSPNFHHPFQQVLPYSRLSRGCFLFHSSSLLKADCLSASLPIAQSAPARCLITVLLCRKQCNLSCNPLNRYDLSFHSWFWHFLQRWILIPALVNFPHSWMKFNGLQMRLFKHLSA